MNELKTGQICAFYVAFMPILEFFTAFSAISRVAREDMWLSLLIGCFIDFLCLTAFYFLTQNHNKNFYELLEENFGKGFAKTILFIFAIFFLVKGFLPIAEHKNFIEVTLYDTTPSIFSFLPFFVAGFFISMAKFRVLGRCAEILWIFTVFSCLLLFALSFNNTDFASILPIGAQGGIRIFKGSLYSFLWGGKSIFFLFFSGRFVRTKKSYLLISLSYALTSVIVIVASIIFYGTFQSLSGGEYYALTEISKFSNIISTTARFDYIAIYMIIFNVIFSLSAYLFLANFCLNNVFNFKHKFIPSLIVNLLMLIAVYFLEEHFENIQNFLLNYGSILFFIIFSLLPIILLLIINGKKYDYQKKFNGELNEDF